MVDEAHERSLSTDLLLGLLRKVIAQRPDLRILISSASLEVLSHLSIAAATHCILSLQLACHGPGQLHLEAVVACTTDDP